MPGGGRDSGLPTTALREADVVAEAEVEAEAGQAPAWVQQGQLAGRGQAHTLAVTLEGHSPYCTLLPLLPLLLPLRHCPQRTSRAGSCTPSQAQEVVG